jgi:hypothetical protein
MDRAKKPTPEDLRQSLDKFEYETAKFILKSNGRRMRATRFAAVRSFGVLNELYLDEKKIDPGEITRYISYANLCLNQSILLNQVSCPSRKIKNIQRAIGGYIWAISERRDYVVMMQKGRDIEAILEVTSRLSKR